MPRATLDTYDALVAELEAAVEPYDTAVTVCTCTTCVAAGSLSVRDAFVKALESRGLDERVRVVPTGYNGFCTHGPVCVVHPEGIFYEGLRPGDVPEIIESHLEGGTPVERLLHRDGDRVVRYERELPFFAKQEMRVLQSRGKFDPLDIGDALRHGAYRSLVRLLREGRSGEAIIEEVLRSGLRGRGGGGFPTGLKWKSCAEAVARSGERPYVVCNGDEGDPGAYMDRGIIEADPHAVLEGMLIGALALGAREGFVYIRREYPLALERLRRAIDQARQWGFLGESVLGTDFAFDVTIHQGAGAFVCGESTALMASMEGRAGEPRAKYVHTVEQGLRGKPTVLNNVETWANIPLIMERGAEWFASIGTGDVSENPWNGSSGTKVFSLVGNVVNSGLVEVPMGITLREVVYDIGGGIPRGRAFKAIQTGGPSGGCLPAEKLDLPVDFDSLTEAGSMMGSGGLIVMDDRTCMVDVAKYFVDFLMDESCGKCTPCREGLAALHEILGRITTGEGREEDLSLLTDIGGAMKDGSLCGLGQTAANPVASTLRYFREEYEAHIHEKRCPAGQCKALVTYTIDAEACTGCMLCVKPCPTDAISGERKAPHVIDQDKCIQCGTCLDACNDDAVVVK